MNSAMADCRRISLVRWQSQFSTLLLILEVFSTTELIAAQTLIQPLNTAANVGDRVTIYCSTNSSKLPQWRYHSEDNEQSTPISTVGDCFTSLIPSRFVVLSLEPGNCNLIIPKATAAEALAYQCTDGLFFDHWMLLTIIESVEVHPNSSSSSSVEEPCEGDPLNLTCRVKYTAYSSSTLQMFPSIYWEDLSADTYPNGTAPSPMPPNVTASYLSIIATPTVVSYRCEAYFNAPTLPPNFATNAPFYYKSVNTKELKVQYLSERGSITSNSTSPCVDETTLLTCEVNGHPTPSYKWINADTNDVLSNTTDVIINSGGHYVCVVNSNACNSTTTVQMSCNNEPKCTTCRPASGTVISYDDTEVGGRIVLTCSASGLPEPKYEWKTGDIKTGDRDDLNVYENGNYTCVAYNFIHGIRNSDNYTVSVTGIVPEGNSGYSSDSIALLLTIIVLLLIFVLPPCILLLCYGCSKSCREKIDEENLGIKESLPTCMNGTGSECSRENMCFFFYLLIACGIVFVPYVLIASLCCRKNSKNSQGSRGVDISHHSDESDRPGPSHDEGLERNPQTNQVYEGLSRRPEYANATGIDGSSTLESNNHQQTQSHYEELQRNQQIEATVAYQELVRAVKGNRPSSFV